MCACPCHRMAETMTKHCAICAHVPLQPRPVTDADDCTHPFLIPTDTGPVCAVCQRPRRRKDDAAP